MKYDRMVEKREFDFLHGLNSDLDEVRGILLGIKPFPSLKEVFAEVRREESRKRVILPYVGHAGNEGYSALSMSRGKASASTKGEI